LINIYIALHYNTLQERGDITYAAFLANSAIQDALSEIVTSETKFKHELASLDEGESMCLCECMCVFVKERESVSLYESSR
jgi:hypothetical protein